MRHLSPHFLASEFACRGQAAPDAWLYWARKLCLDYLEPLRADFGAVRIHSGWRTASHNRSVGGAPASYHLRIAGRRGAGCDLTCARGQPSDWHKRLDELGVPGLGLYAGHVHADNRRGRARW